ncbi:hypothetical protein ACFFRR_001452 [Megaselia abdita]
MSNNFVVLDCDTGSDDAWALLFLLKADRVKKVKLLGVTCVNGNTTVENAVENTLKILELSNRSDIPVYKGSTSPLIPTPRAPDFPDFHGSDGFGCLPSKQKTVLSPKGESSVQALYEFACQYPKQVSYLLVGPLTNFALCLKVYQDFYNKVKDVFIMGGNSKGMGNTTKSAEFNFYSDPEAAHIVLSESRLTINILPWETCLLDTFMISLDWRLNVLGSHEHKAVQLLNDVEKVQYSKFNIADWTVCDAFLAAAFLFPEKFVIKDSFWNATVELHGGLTRGQMVLDHLRKDETNVRIIEKLNLEFFKQIALWSVDHEDFIEL